MLQDERDIDFELLFNGKKNDTLLLIEGGLCLYHFRRDAVCTIRVLISTKAGAGSFLFTEVCNRARKAHMLLLRAVCPADLESNLWYKKKGLLSHQLNFRKQEEH